MSIAGYQQRDQELTNSKGTIEHSSKEADTIAPSSGILKIPPNKAITSMLRRHRSNHNNSHKPATNNQRHPNILQMRNQPIEENHKRRAKPRDRNKHNVRMPRLHHKVRVVVRVHLHDDVRRDRDHGRHVEDPAEEVQRAAEEADAAAPGARGHGSPVVDAARGRHAGSELCDRGGDEAVEYDRDDELVEDAGRAAVEDGDGQ